MRHRGSRVDGGNLDLAVAAILDDDIARQQRADLVLGLKSPMCEWRIAGAEDAIGAPIGAELGLERCLPSISVSTPKTSSLRAAVTLPTAASNGTHNVFAM